MLISFSAHRRGGGARALRLTPVSIMIDIPSGLQEPDSDLARSSLYDIMRNLSSVPDEWRTAIRNNGGGFINHIFYFITMRNKVYTAPRGELEEQVNATFGDYETFMKEFGQAASSLFGSGYVWLVEDEERNISIVTTANQVGACSWGAVDCGVGVGGRVTRAFNGQPPGTNRSCSIANNLECHV